MMQIQPVGGVQLPQDPAFAIRYLNELALQFQGVLDELNLSFYSLSYAAPDKPRELMFRFADGTTWNPGAGKGLYQYVDGIWLPLLGGVGVTKVEQLVAQTLVEATWTTISFGQASINKSGMFAIGSPTKLTVVVSGTYLIAAQVAFAPAVCGWDFAALRAVRVFKNTDAAANMLASSTLTPNEANIMRASCVGLCSLVAGDELYLQGYQYTNGLGNTLDTAVATNRLDYTYLLVVRV